MEKRVLDGRVAGGWQTYTMVRLEANGKLRVLYTEPDGHAQWTAGAASTTHFVGVYGLEVVRFGNGPEWALDQYQGAEPDHVQEVLHRGARHLVLRDGMWLQPEPLLHLGMTTGDLAHPLAYGSVYAGATRTSGRTRTATSSRPRGTWRT